MACKGLTILVTSIVEIKVLALNRTGLFAEILNALISLSKQIKSAQAKPIGNEQVECSFAMEVSGISELQNIVDRIKKLQSVKQVYIGSKKNK